MAVFFSHSSTAEAPFQTAYLDPKGIGKVARDTEGFLLGRGRKARFFNFEMKFQNVKPMIIPEQNKTQSISQKWKFQSTG